MIFHPKMMPAQVILDPELTVPLPPKLTAGTGMDALAHCLEAYFSPAYHPMAEGIAVEGVRLVKEYLPRAFRDGADLEARGNMLTAAAAGATAFQKGLGAIHSLSHPVGALYGTHHGLTNAVFMPYVLDFNREAIGTRPTASPPGSASTAASPGCSTSCSPCAATSASRTPWMGSASTTRGSRRWRPWRSSTRPPAATPAR